MTFFEDVNQIPPLQQQCLCDGAMSQVALAAGTQKHTTPY